MKTNKIRLWQLAGLAAVVLAAKVYSKKKPNALPAGTVEGQIAPKQKHAEKE